MTKIYNDNAPSELFEDAFRDCFSGCRRECGCGRTCFDNANGGYHWDEGELEALLKGAKEDPEHYVALDYSCATMTIDGVEWVMGCPCNAGRRYQEFIDRHAQQIAKYLNAKSKSLIESARAMTVSAPAEQSGG